MGKKIRVWDGSAWQDVAPSLPYTAIHSAQASMPATGVDGQVWLDTDGTLAGQNFVPLSGGTMTGNLNTPSINGGGVTGRNYLINGGFDIWQRGTSHTSAIYTADRWFQFGNDSITRQSFNTTSPEIPNGLYYMRYQATQAGAYHYIEQRIENGHIDLSGKTITISFWGRSNTGSNNSFSILTALNNDSQLYSANFTLTTTWQKYYATFTIAELNYAASYRYLRMGGIGDSGGVDLAQIKYEIGSAPTEFSRAGITIQGELSLCQRYYYTLPYNYNSARSNPYTDFLIMNTADQTTWARGVVQFPVTMRATPSLESPTAANYFLLGSAGVLSVTSISIDNMTNASMAVVNAYRTGMSTGTTYFLRFANNTTDYLRFSAEL
jgi:hypothetical protein